MVNKTDSPSAIILELLPTVYGMFLVFPINLWDKVHEPGENSVLCALFGSSRSSLATKSKKSSMLDECW